MVIVQKVLKRKDASSVVVAIVLGLVVLSLISAPATQITDVIVNGQGKIFDNWKQVYLAPLVLAALQVIFLEIVGWIWVSISQAKNRK